VGVAYSRTDAAGAACVYRNSVCPVACPLDGAYTSSSVPRLTHLHGGVGVSAMPGYETLRKGRDIDRVFDNGHWHRTHPVSISILARDDVGVVRVCFITGRRIGNAVDLRRGPMSSYSPSLAR